MTHKRTAIAVLIAMLGAVSIPTFAQEGPGGPDGHGGPGDEPMRHAQHGPDDGPRGGDPIPHRDWHRGDRLPPDYRGRNYVVDDWRDQGLQPPPRGYQWVGVNGDYVLAAVATGVIANILLSPHR
ncbi:RcnB family protein [Paraburkholderia sp.]|uniref:RcnB family protein n=1 Tax=Paraburkholderia sp. TaxID=1926495 RepID=UPI00239D59A5|nr:RcnB family protein [Paraburkholderia sp.]MDE1179845.1 RcnB family protein [Paraburkholderia sp.]